MPLGYAHCLVVLTLFDFVNAIGWEVKGCTLFQYLLSFSEKQVYII